MKKLYGYMEIADGLVDKFKDYCKNHNVKYENVNNDGLYRVYGSPFSILKLSYHMTKLHDEYLGNSKGRG